MQSVSISANNQTLPISNDGIKSFTAYSSEVHKVITTVILGIFGFLLQLINQRSSVYEGHKAAFLCFGVFFLFYAVLRVREAIEVQLRPGLVHRLIGHTSHLFGGLAALVLIYVISASFALVLLLLWLLWHAAVVYYNFNESMIYWKANISGAGLPQSSPV